MANTKISALPSASTLDLTEIVPVVQSSTTKKVALSAFAVPTGGTTGQVLTRQSSGWGWVTPATGGGGGGTASAVVLTATNDGSADTTSAFNSAAAAAAAAGLPLRIPAGNYLTTSGWIVPAGVTVLGSGINTRVFGSRGGTWIVQLNSNTVIRDLFVENTIQQSCFAIDVAQNSSRVIIDHVKVTGLGVQGALYIGVTGVNNVLMQNCWIDNVAFGVLTNQGATDLQDVKIVNNTFTNITQDGLEFNHPSGGLHNVKNFYVAGNTITVPAGAGSGSTAGFGIGAAGVSDLRIIGNTIVEARHEGIHIEDGSWRVTIANNTIASITSTDAYAGIGIYQNCNYITITGNTITSCKPNGIILVYDNNTTGHNNIVINGNVIDNTGAGINVGGDAGRANRFVVSNNIITNTDIGIQTIGNHPTSSITDNIIDACTQYGIRNMGSNTFAAVIRAMRGNVITNAAITDYFGIGIGNANATLVHDRYAYQEHFGASTSATLNVPLFRLGEYATGRITVQAQRESQYDTRADVIFQISWNGTTFIVNRLVSKNGGSSTLDFTNLAMINGVCNVITNVGGSGVYISQLNGQFSGECFETNETYTGTVTGATS